MGRPVGGDRLEAACTLADRAGAVVLLKGPGHGDRDARRSRSRSTRRAGRARHRRQRRRAHRHRGRAPGPRDATRSRPPRPAPGCTGGPPTTWSSGASRPGGGRSRRPACPVRCRPWECRRERERAGCPARSEAPRCGARSISTRCASNVAALCAMSPRPAQLLAVVKADGYGHGAVPVARAALDAGATWLGCALGSRKASSCATAGIDAPIILLSEPVAARAATVVAHRLTPVVYTARRDRRAGQGRRRRRRRRARSRCTSRSTPACTASAAAPDDARRARGAGRRARRARLGGRAAPTSRSPTSPTTRTPPSSSRGSTRCSTTSPPPGSGRRRARREHRGAAHACRGPLRPRARRHRALRHPPGTRARRRCGDRAAAGAVGAGAGHVREGGASRGAGVVRAAVRGRRTGTSRPCPSGYADGVPRNLGQAGGEVLVGGRRRPIAGTVTMDQLLVDVGDVDAASSTTRSC